MAPQGTNQLPLITQLPSHYDLSVFEMDACDTTLNIQSIPIPSASSLSVSLPSDNDIVPDVTNNVDDNAKGDDNVKLDRDNENIVVQQ